MSTALSTLITSLMDAVGDTLTEGTVDSGSQTTIVDAARTESDNEWNNAWVRIDTDAGGESAAPEDEERRITGFTASSDSIAVFPAFTASPAIGDTYSIREVFSYDQYKRAVNHAIRMAHEWWPDITVTTYVATSTVGGHIVICSEQLDYALPTVPATCKHVYEAWINIPNVEEMGTATSSTTTTLVDSGQSWTADEHIDGVTRYVVIYDGTGKGQTRLITDNDTTSVTVATWTTNPDTTSKYKIIDVTDETAPWSRIADAYIDIAGGYIRFPGQHTEGAWVRLKYESEPSTLSASDSTTSVPEEYILYKAAASLWAKKKNDPDARWWAQWNEQQAETYTLTHRKRKPYGTIWGWDDAETIHAYDSPFR